MYHKIHVFLNYILKPPYCEKFSFPNNLLGARDKIVNHCEKKLVLQFIQESEFCMKQ